MHERTRKLLGRTVFVLCCALPTCLTILLVIWFHTPWYHQWLIQRAELRLQDWLGMRFEIQQIEVLAPSALRLTGVSVHDPETGTLVAKARMVRWVKDREQMSLMIHQPEVESAQLTHAWKLFHDRFLCRPELTDLPIRMAAADMTIRSKSGSATLQNLDLYVKPNAQAAHVTASFHLAGSRGTRPAIVSATRDRTHDLPRTVWVLKSGDAPLPCSVLADYSPWMKKLGPKAEFLGSLSWCLEDAGWNIDLSGCQFEGVELARVFDMPWRQLTGTANLDFRRFRIANGRLTDIAGSLQVLGEGRIGRDLFEEAERSLGVALQAERLRGQDLHYDHLHLDFQLQEQDLQIAARVMKSGEQIAATRKEQPAIPAVTIAKLVAPDHAWEMPVSPQSMNLIDFLPLPRAPIDSAALKPPRLKLREQF